jgi:hypothetical protein
MADDFEGDETEAQPLTIPELRAIKALLTLAKTWPSSLTLCSIGGSLVVKHTQAIQDADTATPSNRYAELCDVPTLYDIDGIPNASA